MKHDSITNIISIRVVHSFTCAGVIQTQYIKFCTFVGMGHVEYGYMKKGNYSRLRSVELEMAREKLRLGIRSQPQM